MGDARSGIGSENIVYLLGGLEVRDSATDERLLIPAGRAELLLQRIAAAPSNGLPVEALVDCLWSATPPPTSTRIVASLVSRLRRDLGREVVRGDSREGYAFGPSPRWQTDIQLVEQLSAEANRRLESAPALAASAAHRGLTMLNRGDVLSGIDAEWADDVRRHVENIQRRLQRTVWDADIRLERWTDLIEQAEVVLSKEPHAEEAARALMTAHWRRGDRGAALRSHDQLRAALRDELDAEPSSITEQLYETIVNDTWSGNDRDPESGAAANLPDLPGRHAELQTLVDTWNKAAAGKTSLIAIHGPPGSGRTRLCQTLATFVGQTGGLVLQTSSSEGERSLFLRPLLAVVSRLILSTPPENIDALLGPWLGTAAELIPELREIIEIAPYQRSSADLEHLRALQTIERVLTLATNDRPVVMILDDVDLAGSSTIEAIHWLLHELGETRLLIVATHSGEIDEPGLTNLVSKATTIELGPISRQAVSEIVSEAGLSEEAEFVWDLTKGHVLFVNEVIDALEREEPRESIATSIQSIVLDRTRRLGPDVQSTLQKAAVIGLSFDIDTLIVLGGRSSEEVLTLIETAINAGLVEGRDESFAFSNQIIREVLYTSLHEPVRRDLHLRVSELLDDRPERRATHLESAGQLGDASSAWLEAAQLAQRDFANTDAERLFSAAVRSGTASNRPSVIGEALTGRGTARVELGNYAAASDDHLAAERLGISIGDRDLRARAVERLGWVAYYERDVTTAISRAEQATALTEARPTAWVLLGRIKHWAGDFDAATDAYNRAIEGLGEQSEAVQASTLSCLGALLAHSDRYDDAIDVLDEAIGLCHEIGAFRPLLRSLFFEGLARANSGDLTGALTALETKRTLLSRYDVSFYRARTNTCLAWVWRELGDLERADSLSRLALSQSREVSAGDLQVEQELHALCSLAECALIKDDHTVAAEHLATATPLLAQWLPFHWRAELRLVELLVRLGTEDAERLLELSQDRGSAKYEALSFHHLGRPAEAARAASPTASLLLLAEVSPTPQARVANQQLVARLPKNLRRSFASEGRLARLKVVGPPSDSG